MKIALVRPPSIINPAAYIGSLTPPIGLAYLAAALRKARHDVVLIDGIGENPLQSVLIRDGLVLRGLTFEELIGRIPKDADIVGVSCMFSSEWTQIRGLINKISENLLPNQLLVGGGEHFTACPELSMTHCPRIDACIIGEGEEAIVDLANAVAEKRPLSEVNGLVIKKENKFFSTPRRDRIKMIDDIPKPAWDMVPLENYLKNSLSYGVNRGRSMPMLASRGCPYQCTFCSNPAMWTTRWISRNPKLVVAEIQEYIEKYDISNVDFYDLTAIVKKEWIIDFCKELIAKKINITWQLPSGTRSEAIDTEVSQWLFKAGCRNLNYAPESGSDVTLSSIKKKVKLPRLLDSLKGAVGSGLNVKINIIIGLPCERHYDVLKTLLFLIKLSWYGAHDVSIGVFAPYPGSELYNQLVKSGKIPHDDTYFDKLAYVDITETISYTDHISSAALRRYNWIGFALFYGSNYLFRPIRLIKTIRNLATKEHESRGEMALAALLGRLSSVKFGSST